jgi:exoribonuclease II
MIERGLIPDFPGDALAQLDAVSPPESVPEGVRDERGRLWCSIDNDDSRDLDQLSAWEPTPKGDRIYVAVADVDALVPLGSPIDERAEQNTTSVYTSGGIFPMLPERLSTDLTSLNPHVDRLAIVIVYEVLPDGEVGETSVYRGMVRNQAKLAYPSITAWLEGQADPPGPLAAMPTLQESLRRQDAAAQRLRKLRHERGALELESLETRAVIEDGKVVGIVREPKSRAKELIEDFMIAANGVTARFLETSGRPSLRRVVRSPERWERLVAYAREFDDELPDVPDAKALEEFLHRRRLADPLRFPDVSLSVVKMMGAGEYVVENPGEEPIGHFGLAVRDYNHSTAPNRRFPDLVTQRLIKSAIAGTPPPYSGEDLEYLARHCTEQEDAADKVERKMRKSAAALMLSTRVGERFDALVTGSSEKGVFVRVIDPPVEGKLVSGGRGLDVGDRVRVQLLDTDVEQGFIDFARSRR